MSQPTVRQNRNKLIALRRQLAEHPSRLLEQVVDIDSGVLEQAIAYCTVANAGHAQEAEMVAIVERVRELQTELSMLILFLRGHVTLNVVNGSLAAGFSPLAGAEGRSELGGTEWLGAIAG